MMQLVVVSVLLCLTLNMVSADADLTDLQKAENNCSPEDRKEAAELWATVWNRQFTSRRIALAQTIYEDIFYRYPEAIKAFKRLGVSSTSDTVFKAYLIRVVGRLDILISYLPYPEKMSKQLQFIATRHVKLQGQDAEFKAEYKKMVHRDFSEVMLQGIGEYNGAWDRCFDYMIKAVTAGLD